MSQPSIPPLPTVGQLATIAVLLEVTTPKPGNVHRGADFDDMTFTDMALGAVAIGPAMQHAADPAVRIGQTIFDAVSATEQLVGKNTNLGTVLLFAPIAAATGADSAAALRIEVGESLQRLNEADATLVYEAIRLAGPGGLGTVDEHDVAEPAPTSLMAAMRMAEDRDLVARQFTTDFETVFEFVVPKIAERVNAGMSLQNAIIATHVLLMAEHADSLIARKCGQSVADQSCAMAGVVAECGNPTDEAYLTQLAEFDFWLRSDGHRRNPGTTADLIAAGLFAGMRTREIHVR